MLENPSQIHTKKVVQIQKILMLQETGIGKTLIHYNLLEVGFEPTQVIGIIP